MAERNSDEGTHGMIEELLQWLFNESTSVEALEAALAEMMNSGPLKECTHCGKCGKDDNGPSSSTILIEYQTARNGMNIDVKTNVSGPPELGAIALMEAICVLLCAKHTHISKKDLFERLIQVLSEMGIMNAVVIPVDMRSKAN